MPNHRDPMLFFLSLQLKRSILASAYLVLLHRLHLGIHPPGLPTQMAREGRLRPVSALSLQLSDNRSDNADDDPGEWTMIVSRFHFVDLPGIVFFINFFPVADDVSSSSRLWQLVNISWRVF